MCHLLSVAINSLDKITKKGKTKIYKYAPEFTDCLYYSFWSTSVILLYFFYSDDDLSINKFFQYAINNFENIFTHKFYDVYQYPNKSEKREVKFDKEDFLKVKKNVKKKQSQYPVLCIGYCEESLLQTKRLTAFQPDNHTFGKNDTNYAFKRFFAIEYYRKFIS